MSQHANRLLVLACTAAGVALLPACGSGSENVGGNAQALQTGDDDSDSSDGVEKTLYIWTGDQARVEPDMVVVINFNPNSENYGKIVGTVPVPAPNNVGNEAHHCHVSADKKVLACGGLLSLLHGAADYFLFDITSARHPKFMKRVSATQSHIADDFLPLPQGGFLVTNMGSASGGAPGRIVELDKNYDVVQEYPTADPLDGSPWIGSFNPHGIDADFGKNELVTSDFVNPVTTLNVWSGPLELRSSLRFWDLANRRIVRSVFLPDQAGTMDVKIIPHDPHGRAITANMFTGLVYTADPTDGSYVQSFDCEDIVPHVEVPVAGGMIQLLAMPRSGTRVLFASFLAGQVGMLDITNPSSFSQVAVVSFGMGAGPHDIDLTADDSRLVVTDYFLNEDDFGKVHAEGDHKVHVINRTDTSLSIDQKFGEIDFNTAFATPKRPHGIAMK
jgi:hypothetical protein